MVRGVGFEEDTVANGVNSVYGIGDSKGFAVFEELNIVFLY